MFYTLVTPIFSTFLARHLARYEVMNMQVDEKFSTVSVQQYGNEKWRATFPYRTADGKWSNKTRVLKTTGRDTGRSKQVWKAASYEAEQLRQKLNEEAEEERTGRKKGETVADYVSSYVEGRRLHVERSTYAEYGRILTKLISPSIGSIELDELAPDAVQKWINGLAKEFAPVTVRKALVLLRSAMTQAVERDRLAKNPTRTVKSPKLDSPKPNALDERGRAKVARFIALDPSTRLNIGFGLALYMGLREGEICGLRWRDVDLERGSLSIEQTIGHEGSRWYVKEPKTGGSRRTLFIPDVLIAPLRERTAQVREEAIAAGLSRDALSELFVVGNVDGTFMQPHYLSSKWRKAADVLELVGTQGKRPTFHDLRHTFATSAIAHGVDVKTVSSMMGHANAAMTMNTYADADPDAKKRGAETVARALQSEALKHEKDGQVLELHKTGTNNR